MNIILHAEHVDRILRREFELELKQSARTLARDGLEFRILSADCEVRAGNSSIH